LKINKTLISYFSAHFSSHNQILESIFQFIFHYTIRKIIYFSGIYFSEIYFLKKIIFQQTNRAWVKVYQLD